MKKKEDQTVFLYICPQEVQANAADGSIVDSIESKIFNIRGKQVMLDRDLAVLYGVETKVLNQAVKRNHERFPEDFMFQLTYSEYNSLRSQFVTSNKRGGNERHQIETDQKIDHVLNCPMGLDMNIIMMNI